MALAQPPAAKRSIWFHQRVNGAKGQIKNVMIVSLARKLLVALWHFVETDEIPEEVRPLWLPEAQTKRTC
ncbi:hypothetical protein IYW40_00195 [Methylocystis sp. H4A]|uniref:hypothetical protein n=1 Tax=Methylocystis sp. H4A TaxID=2785788 RepID=UPI0018C347E7|nr:hypothetical protein [Methylocystis sp. H4A]MBG0799957.1 hypothetical protein [Methylocystis sp. H4A]